MIFSTRNLYSFVSWITIFVALCFFGLRCSHRENYPACQYTFTQPNYDLVALKPAGDTLHFSLDDDTYNALRSVNVFVHNGKEYISIFDKRSGKVIIYDVVSGQIVRKLDLNKHIPGKKLYKTTVYAHSFDSIFVTNFDALYLLDIKGQIKQSVDFLSKPKHASAALEITGPPVIKDGNLYTSVRPHVDYSSFSDLRTWKTLYRFDFDKRSASLHYGLPTMYTENLYGSEYLDYSHCYDHRGRFVFSFPADSLIYATDLAGYHAAYYAKSRYHKVPIQPISKELVSKDGLRHYMTQDSYGPIYFDPVTKRYLRLARNGITNTDFDAKNRQRKQYLLIFDEEYRIIGESPVDPQISLKCLFITRDGSIYARINTNDEYALHFIRLTYMTNTNITESPKLANYETTQTK